ncbi:MAG: RecQ family ATP-dependent DNA helicase [Oscillospiraceae bacterium]|nr:RecQ family ATP-dependent DNA helicase [Oscillospiraceae bacterium]
MKKISFIDTEVSETDNKAYDFGTINQSGDKLHTGSANEFHSFIKDAEYLCGHNIINHDSKYVEISDNIKLIDTLYLSPILFPNKPYHSLLKDDKLLIDELNNPLNDAQKAMELFYDEVNAFAALDDELKLIYYMLLKDSHYFSGFFEYVDYTADDDLETAVRVSFLDKICENAPLSDIIADSPVELAYCLALISATEEYSLIPRWVQINYPKVDMIMHTLRNVSCRNCVYCRTKLNPDAYLGKYFGYSEFRKYNGEPLQEKAVAAAVEHKSLLAIFPTGGGKSLTFQIPALMAGETERALTIVISPLQSLMKDQVDNLEKRGIAEAVTINGLLSPIERAEAIERVESGIASILYISPESLRSATIERLFLSRNINRFVIDEAHCFSAWGQDFRVDYLYIGDFIRELQEKKGNGCKIPVSCFTATAKQKVISDIKEYFKNKLNVELELFTTNASRTNLRYEVLYKETDEEKYESMRSLIEQHNCPTIVYVSRTKRTRQLAEKLTNDGFKARAFNGKMDSSEKQENQEAFINDEVQVIVATSAFGMGVDKSNVKLVIHYDISDSLENYVQEAGRAGRDQSLQAECYVLFNDSDLDKHFILLNQTKLSISEIQQVWKAIKELTRTRNEVCCSPLEIARQAGWDDSVADIETRVKTAVQALENAGYIKRGKNVPRIYATSIVVKSMTEAAEQIDSSFRFQNDVERTTAKRIISSLISSKSIAAAGNTDAESRVDYLADRLGIEKQNIIHSIQKMREDGLLADAKDLTAYIQKTDTVNKSMLVLHRFQALETFMLDYINADSLSMNYKALNEAAIANGVRTSSVNSIKTLFYYWTIRSYIQKEQDQATNRVVIVNKIGLERMKAIRQRSYDIAEFIINYLFSASSKGNSRNEEELVSFSVLELMKEYQSKSLIDITENDIEEALLFLSKIGALKLEGGFLVLYSGMQIKRLVLDNKIRYKIEDYKQLNEFYQQKIQQIHIVGEYANMMVRDYNEALQFVNDYFQMDYKKFLSKYFSGERAAEIERNITPEKYRQLFDALSPKQLEIIKDNNSNYIVVSAGPGSGKTRVLVHKLASLLLLEDVKHEQLLMLTFSRAAAIEFKQRLRELIGNAANFIEIKTFHSYCFDLIGKIGSLKASENVVKDAVELISSGDVDQGRITKAVLVIDEAQDMDVNEYSLVEILMKKNEDMRVIAVGDDDQNIYKFRGSDSKYLKEMISKHGAKQYSLTDNYRSCKSIINFANRFVTEISDRMKTEKICAVTDNIGEIKLVKHSSRNMETALVEDMLSAKTKGTTCILTNTNEEALLILGVLKQKDVPAKLIQSIDGFDLYQLAELRMFLKKLDAECTSPVISNEQWNNAVNAINEIYKESDCLPLIMNIINTFAQENEKKYRTDFDLYLHESKIEDFYSSEYDVVTVSTMHKSKGREFDNVYMLCRDVSMSCDEEKRKLYVAMTRAKSQLHIHYYGDVFDRFAEFASAAENDTNTYHKPSELILQLSHSDVYLDFFKDKKNLILRLKSGDHLFVRGNRMYVKFNDRLIPVFQFSAKCNDKIKNLLSSGYVPYDAVVRFICAWKGKEDEEETAVILADIYLRRIM